MESSTLASNSGPHTGGTHGSQIWMSSIINYLTHVHSAPAKAQAIKSAASFLEIMILSHASFLFSSPTLLTKDALCRAFLILSNRCREHFKQSIIVNRDCVVSKRTNRKRFLFIYSALACPSQGKSQAPSIIRRLSMFVSVR